MDPTTPNRPHFGVEYADAVTATWNRGAAVTRVGFSVTDGPADRGFESRHEWSNEVDRRLRRAPGGGGVAPFFGNVTTTVGDHGEAFVRPGAG